MKIFYSDTFELPLPENHRFPMAKYTRLREKILSSNLSQHCQLDLPPAATDEQLSRVHDVGYVEAVKCGNLSDLQIRRIGFPWSEKMVERSRRSTGASIAAGIMAVSEGISINLAGGTHHAFADSGQGFCVFNDVCVAARNLQHQGLARNVLFVDLDVHQGNGTSAIAKGDDTLFAFSIHCDKNYPFQKTAGDLDVALPPGSDDTYYLQQLKLGLQEIGKRFEPDFVFYLAGADPFEGDRLGLLNLTKAGLQKRDEAVIHYFRDLDIPIALSMAGGYANNIDDIVDIHFATVSTAVKRFQRDRLQL